MKIHIAKKESEVKDEEITLVHPDEIDRVENGTCEYVRLGTVLDEYANREELFTAIMEKVRYNGVLNVAGLDIDVMARAIVNGQFENAHVNSLVYNGNNSMSDMQEMKTQLESRGFKIKASRYDGPIYFLEALRPKPNA